MSESTSSTTTSAARTGTSSNLPVQLDDWDLEEFYHDKLYYCSGPDPACDYAKNILWKHTLDDKVTFQSVPLMLAAGHRASCSPTDNNQKSFEQYVQSTEPALECYLRTTLDNDATRAGKFAMVRAGQALGEARFGSPSRSQTRISEALTVLQQRKGAIHPVTTTWIHFVYYMMQVSSKPSDISVSQDEASAFTTFLQSAERLSLLQRSHTWSRRVASRERLFRPGSALHNMLATPAELSPKEKEARQSRPWDIVRGQSDRIPAVARLACLLHINAALSDLRDSYENTAAYLDYLEDKVRQFQLDRYPTVESFVWILMEQESDPEVRSHDRPTFVGKLLRVSRRMDAPVCDWLADTLLRYLSFQTTSEWPEMGQWEKSLQQEILRTK